MKMESGWNAVVKRDWMEFGSWNMRVFEAVGPVIHDHIIARCSGEYPDPT